MFSVTLGRRAEKVATSPPVTLAYNPHSCRVRTSLSRGTRDTLPRCLTSPRGMPRGKNKEEALRSLATQTGYFYELATGQRSPRGLGHARRRCGREMRAPILDQPSIAVADGHEEKVDRYHGDDRPIWTVDIAHGEQRVNDRDIGFDEADPVVGERRLRGAVDGLLRLGTKVLHHCDPPLQKLTLRRHEGSVFGK